MCECTCSGLCLRRTPIFRPETLSDEVALECPLRSEESEEDRPCRTMPFRLVGKLKPAKQDQIRETMLQGCAQLYLQLHMEILEELPLYRQLQSLSNERFLPYHCLFPRAVMLSSQDKYESCECALLAAASAAFHVATLGLVWWLAYELTTCEIALSLYDFQECRFEFGEHPYTDRSYHVDLSSHTLTDRPVPISRTSHRFSNSSVRSSSVQPRRRSHTNTSAEPDPEDVANALQNVRASGSLPLPGAPMETPPTDVLVAWGSTTSSSSHRRSSYIYASSDPSPPPLQPPRLRPICRTIPMDLEVLNEISKPTSECVVCCAAVPDVVLFPCLHTCLCAQCVTKLIDVTDKCPLCRRTIEEYVLDLNHSPCAVDA